MTQVRNPLVEWLLRHAYGQGGSVAVPSREESGYQAPKGEFPPGIRDVLDQLAKRYGSWRPGDPLEWCFLIGGPGNGKSECLRSLAKLLGVQLPTRQPDQPAPRTVPPGWPRQREKLPSDLEIAFVNDASIPRPDSTEGGAGSLFLDIGDALRQSVWGQTPIALFVNVNRGILVEETRGLKVAATALQALENQFAAGLITWLSSPPSPESAETSKSAEPPGFSKPGQVETTVHVKPDAPQYGQCQMVLPGELTIIVHAIFLDVLSLLEPSPGAGSAVVDFSKTPPHVAPYRTLGSLVSTHVTRDETTAGRFLKDFAEAEEWQDKGCREPETGRLCEAFSRCPFAQNARWLQSDSLRQRFLDAMRAGEVAAGRRYTYRDLLGHISLAFLGQPEPSWLEGTPPCQWSQNQHRQGGAEASVALQLHRVYVNLFGSGPSEQELFSGQTNARGKDSMYGALKASHGVSGEASRVQAFERAFRDIDPACSADSWNGMRARVLDAVESLDVQWPSEQLVEWDEIPDEARCQVEHDIDQLLHGEITFELASEQRAAPQQRVRALRRWRNLLMLRQVGLALGQVNFAPAIHEWLVEQESALQRRRSSRKKLSEGLRNLIIPVTANSQGYLAPFRPRTFCISKLPPDTVLVSIERNELDLAVRAQGDVLVAEVQLNQGGERLSLAGLVIDLAIAREALLHGSGDAHSFTEIGYTAFARIERARASLIGRDRLKESTTYFTDQAGQLYSILPNPGGGIPLRVEKE